MKRHAAILFLLCALRCSAQFIPTGPINGTYDASSWDLAETGYMGDYFSIAWSAMYPQYTNSIWSWSRSGSPWPTDWSAQEQKWCLPIWFNWKYPGYNFVVADDNGSISSNQNYTTALEIAAAPPQFYDGTGNSDAGVITTNVQFIALGGPPHDSTDGTGTQLVQDDASTNLAVHFGTPLPFSLWHAVWTNGMSADQGSNRYAWHPFGGSHFSAGGGLDVAIWQLRKMNIETNVSSAVFDWGNAKAYSNQCAIASVSVSGNTLTANIRFLRLAPPFDANGGNTIGDLTNDARYAFLIEPDLGMAFRAMFQITNAPPGTYTVYLNGQYSDSADSVSWAAGRNWFTNCVPTNPTWQQRSNLLAWKRWQKGADPVTLDVLPLGSGHASHILNAVDLPIFQSNAGFLYDDNSLRGMAFLTNIVSTISMTNDVVLMHPFDQAIHDVAQPQTFTLTIVRSKPLKAKAKR